MKFKFISILIFSSLFFQLDAQKMVFTQIRKNFSNLKIPENKSIIVFQSDLDLSFTSSMEKLESPIKKENFYYLTVSERVCIIKVINNVSKSEVELPFGQLSEKTLPIIKKGEYLVFKIEENHKELIVLNQTEVKKGEGLNDNQMLYDKEALLIFNVDPFDLEIELESTQPITAIKHSGKQYKVYIKPIKQEIKVKQKGSDVQGVLNIIQIEPKEVQYFYVSLPEHLRKREVIYDKNISVGDFLIESDPPGALIEIFGNPSFNAEKKKTPYLLKGFESGFKIITLSLSEYESIKDTIQIGSSRKNKSNYKLIPKFAFINITVEPQFPYSSLYVDNQLYSDKNETDINIPDLDFQFFNPLYKTDIKIPVSSKSIEIKAQHFESERINISPNPGEVIYITKELKPIMGKLYLECDENAEKGKVYISNNTLNINKKLLAILPLLDTISIQEGRYLMSIEKDGYGTYNDSIYIDKFKIQNIKINLTSLKMVHISTNVKNVDLIIDGKKVGKSDLKIGLSIGEHSIEIVEKYYEPYKKKFQINANDPIDKTHYFTLISKEFYQTILLDDNPVYDCDLYINNVLQHGGSPYNLKLKKGKYKIVLKSDFPKTKVYKTKLRIPNKTKNLKLPIYFPLNITFLSLGVNNISLGSLGVYGLEVSFVSSVNCFLQNDTNKAFSGLIIPEIRIGGAISKSIDIASFISYNHELFSPKIYSYNMFVGVALYFNIELNKKSFFISELLYIGTIIPYVYCGFLTNITFEREFLPQISAGLRFSMSRTTMFRLWQKPFIDRFRY